MTKRQTTASPPPPPSAAASALVVGVDAGGTTTRALVTTLGGERLGEAWAGGANPNTHGPEHAAEQLTEAIGTALDRAGPSARDAVAATVVGLAGYSGLRDEAVRSRLERALGKAGLTATGQEFTGDDAIAFAAGTAERDGTVLIAGTGAIATRIENRHRSRSADGMGWLIGDEGSAFWIGHQAAKETARQLGRGGDLSPLARTVAKQVIPGQRPSGPDQWPEEHARDFARTLTSAPPINLAGLAPLVTDAYALDDQAAVVIVNAAAGHLAQSVHQVRVPGEPLPVVLSGGVLTHSAPVREALTHKLTMGTGAPVMLAGCTAGGAAWLAALRAGADERDVDLHGVFTRPGADRVGA